MTELTRLKKSCMYEFLSGELLQWPLQLVLVDFSGKKIPTIGSEHKKH
jgi:hypothetical protein